MLAIIIFGNNSQAGILVRLLFYSVVPTVSRLTLQQQRQFIILLQMLLLLFSKLLFPGGQHELRWLTTTKASLFKSCQKS